MDCDFCIPPEKPAKWWATDGIGVIRSCQKHLGDLQEIMPEYADIFPIMKIKRVKEEP